VRNSSLVKWPCAENVTGLSIVPKLWTTEVGSRKKEVRKVQKMAIKSYEDLQIYQKSYQLALQMHRITQDLPVQERYELGQQIRRAATSVPANIAEGYGRKNSEKEFKHFLRNSMGSANEVKVYIDMMKDLGYISQEKHQELRESYDILTKKIYRLIERWNKKVGED
jgi:four helix bundle protein